MVKAGVERRIAEVAERQHGVVARYQLLGAGVSSQQIASRIGCGRLALVHRGVYAVGFRPETSQAAWMAGVLAGGPDALLAWRSAGTARRLIDPIEGPVHVLVPVRGRARPGIVFHQSATIDPSQRSVHDGIPIPSLERTLADLARILSPRQLVRAFDTAASNGRLDRRELARVLELSSTAPGSGRLRALVEQRAAGSDRTRSELERTFRRFCLDRDVPLPSFNVPFAGFEVDGLWPSRRLVVELDSWRHHGDREAFERDRLRDAALQLADARVIRVTDRRLRQGADELESQIRLLLSRA